MAIEIRQIREGDIAGFRAGERKYLLFLEAPPLEPTADFIRANIARGNPQLVAVAREQVVGWCDVVPLGREVTAHVGTLGMGLLPGWRGQGLGEALLRATVEAADVFGFLRVQLGVFASNTRATALYRKLGFVEEGVRHQMIRIDGAFHDEIMIARLRPRPNPV